MFTPVNLKQGGRGWLAYRANKLNASDAAAAMGVHPTRSRRSLVRQIATGIAPEFSQFVQDRVLDKGHEYERLAGPLMAELAGTDLYPVVGYDSDAPKHSASYDGLDMEWRIAAEHKSLNETLRAAMFDGCTGTDLPLYHQAQMEHQCMVCPSIERVLFVASKWDADGNLIEARHCWYTPNPSLRAQLVAAWAAVEEEARTYDPADDEKEELTKKEHEQLPVLQIEVQGQVITSNLRDFERVVRQRIGAINTVLKTDQDFADADVDAKFLRDVADRMRQAVKAVRGKMASVDEVMVMLEALDSLATEKAIALEKRITSEKKARKDQVIIDAQAELDAHIAALNGKLGAKYLPRTIGPFDAATKGLRSLESMEKKLQEALVLCKSDADALAERYAANRAHLEHEGGTWMTLFPDFATVGGKEPADFRGLALLRITQHKEALEAAATAEAARKEQETQAAAAAQISAQNPTGTSMQQAPLAIEPVATPAANVVPMRAAPAPSAPADRGVPTLRIGVIKERLQHMTVTAEDLRALGFEAAGRERAAPLYHDDDFPAICDAIAARALAAKAEFLQSRATVAA